MIVDNNKKEQLYKWAKDLFPMNRSITGPGVRETLQYLKKLNPSLKIKKVKTGEKYFDWTIPEEWFPENAWIKNSKGKKIIDFKKNNLHLLGYSNSIDRWINVKDLNKNLHSLPNQPNAIPYVTSYYKKQWGFCLTHNQRKKLKDKKYHVFIKADHKPGELNYGEIIIKGKTTKEIFLSTYICHPSLANNEVSGPVLVSALARWIKNNSNRKYTYRIIFIPETIGSIVYISKNFKELKKNIIAGFNITCVGDNNNYSYIPSRNEKTLADKVALNVLNSVEPKFKKYTWLDRGSDERQYCSPGIDLPVVTICRSKFAEYKEYHTSLDNLNFISEEGLQTSLELMKKIILSIEKNQILKSKIKCEPHLSSKNLYPTLSLKNDYKYTKKIMDILTYCDGVHDLIDISNKIKIPIWELNKFIEVLINKKILKK